MNAGRHLVAPGDIRIYRGRARTLWGQPVTVTALGPDDYRCQIRVPDGRLLGYISERVLSDERPAEDGAS